MLKQDQIDFYNEHGYLAVEGVLSDAEVEDLRRVSDEFVARSGAVTESDNVFDLEPGHTPESPKLRRLKGPSAQHPVYESTLRHERIGDIVSELIGPHFRTNGDKLNMKSEEFGSPVEWHQDWAFYPHTNDDMLAVGVAIDDMTRENGCLMVIPGSHRGKIYDHHDPDKGYFVGAVTEEEFDDSEAAMVEVEAGGISLHHVRALHGSLPNDTSEPRRLLLLQMCAADAWPLCQPVPDWDAYNANMLRGETTTEPRMVELPFRVPLPAAPRAGSIYENQTLLTRTTFGASVRAG